MSILFTADWHLKLGQKNIPKQWAIDRYYSFFEQINKLEEEVDIHIIGGDLFDRVPTMEELKLYFDFVAGCGIPTYIYDGNHEATRKNKTFLSELAAATRRVNELVQIIDTIDVGSSKLWPVSSMGKFNILPYCALHKKGEIDKLDKSLPLFTHVRGAIEPHVHPEIDLDLLKPFPVVFAGDLHSHSNCQGNIVYPGSPMTTTFHRSPINTGYIVIRDDWEWWWAEFDLPQLIRRTVKTQEEMIPGERDHIIYEIEGDISELSKIKNTDLLDKKIVKRQKEASLILDKEMSIEEELSEYLLYILEIPEESLTPILRTFNDFS